MCGVQQPCTPRTNLWLLREHYFLCSYHRLCIIKLLNMLMCMSGLHANTVQIVSVLCRVLLTVCMLLASVSAENEISVHTSISLSCVVWWNTSLSNIQNVACKWTHEHNVRNWQYTEINAPSRPGQLTSYLLPEATCVLIVYWTVVQLPPDFANYIPSQAIRTDVLKQMCSSSQELIETVHFSNIILLNSFTVKFQASIDNDKSTDVFDSTCYIVLPWFAQPLRQRIFAHISHSMLDYMHILADSLCVWQCQTLTDPPTQIM